MILLLWLYISSIAFLFGAELNSVVDGAEAAVAPAQDRRHRTLSANGGQSTAPPGDGYGRDALAPPEAPVSRS